MYKTCNRIAKFQFWFVTVYNDLYDWPYKSLLFSIFIHISYSYLHLNTLKYIAVHITLSEEKVSDFPFGEKFKYK